MGVTGNAQHVTYPVSRFKHCARPTVLNAVSNAVNDVTVWYADAGPQSDGVAKVQNKSRHGVLPGKSSQSSVPSQTSTCPTKSAVSLGKEFCEWQQSAYLCAKCVKSATRMARPRWSSQVLCSCVRPCLGLPIHVVPETRRVGLRKSCPFICSKHSFHLSYNAVLWHM